MGSKYDLEYPIGILEFELKREWPSGWEAKQQLEEAIKVLEEANKEHDRKRKLHWKRAPKS
jgi:hypothetical protein